MVLNSNNAIFTDVGDKYGFLTTSIEYGLTHPEVKEDLRAYLIALAKELS